MEVADPPEDPVSKPSLELPNNFLVAATYSSTNHASRSTNAYCEYVNICEPTYVNPLVQEAKQYKTPSMCENVLHACTGGEQW